MCVVSLLPRRLLLLQLCCPLLLLLMVVLREALLVGCLGLLASFHALAGEGLAVAQRFIYRFIYIYI